MQIRKKQTDAHVLNFRLCWIKKTQFVLFSTSLITNKFRRVFKLIKFELYSNQWTTFVVVLKLS